MTDTREFTGRTIDEAIDEALRFFGLERDRLEVEIVSGGSAGLLGIGAKKAVVRARPRAAARLSGESPFREAGEADLAGAGGTADIQALAVAAVLRLLEFVAPEAAVSAVLAERQSPEGPRTDALVSLSGLADERLLLDRDGEVLAAIEHLASRIVAKEVPEAGRVRVDVGGFREKQEDALRKTALFLAEKVRMTGKPQSSKPLPADQRRVFHQALETDPEIATRSVGEGPVKRVLVEFRSEFKK